MSSPKRHHVISKAFPKYCPSVIQSCRRLAVTFPLRRVRNNTLPSLSSSSSKPPSSLVPNRSWNVMCCFFSFRGPMRKGRCRFSPALKNPPTQWQTRKSRPNSLYSVFIARFTNEILKRRWILFQYPKNSTISIPAFEFFSSLWLLGFVLWFVHF